jgi:high affinity Mn2+ porin
MRAVTLGAALVYSYAISASTKVSFDYQFVENPGYNTDRGPISVFAARFHSQF